MNKINIDISGLGLIIYSANSTCHIAEGEDYLSLHYSDVNDVLNHIYQGTIPGFCTGSPGSYELNIITSPPDENLITASDYRLRLWVKVTGGKLYFRDLYDLMYWEQLCPSEQIVEINDGNYEVTVCTFIPPSKIIGDNQKITIFLNRVESPPRLKYMGVPMLCE